MQRALDVGGVQRLPSSPETVISGDPSSDSLGLLDVGEAPRLPRGLALGRPPRAFVGPRAANAQRRGQGEHGEQGGARRARSVIGVDMRWEGQLAPGTDGFQMECPARAEWLTSGAGANA